MTGPTCGTEGRGPVEDLVTALRRGSDDAFRTMLLHYEANLWALTGKYLACRADREDALQDALLAVSRSVWRFEARSRLGTWLHRVVVNACLMKLRSNSRRRGEVLLPSVPTAMHSDPDAVRSWAIREETRGRVRACIDRLPEPHRSVLLLRDIEELDTAQTATRLGIAPGAVKTRLHRARQALRAVLGPGAEPV